MGNDNDIIHIIKETDFSIIDTPQSDIELLLERMGDCIIGYDPLEHIVIEEERFQGKILIRDKINK